MHALIDKNYMSLCFPCLTSFFCGNLPIHKAIEYKCQTKIIQQLLNAWLESVNERNDSGMLPLHMACKYHVNYNVINVIFELNRNNAEVTYNET